MVVSHFWVNNMNFRYSETFISRFYCVIREKRLLKTSLMHKTLRVSSNLFLNIVSIYPSYQL